MEDHTHPHSKSTDGHASHGFVTLHLKDWAKADDARNAVERKATAKVNVSATKAEGLIVAFVEDTAVPLRTHEQFHPIFEKTAARFFVLADYFDQERHF